MQQMTYTMRFTGRATPAGPDGNVLRVRGTAPSSTFTSRVGADGLTGTVETIPGDDAVFRSDVTFTDATAFQEAGEIAFGDGHVLRFDTVDRGYIAPSSDLTCKHGTVMWRVESGEGQFAGVSGLITSNFLIGDDLVVTDYQFGVLLLP